MEMLTQDQKWIPAEEVAEAIWELLTREKYVGGTVLEVTGNGTRVVKMIGVGVSSSLLQMVLGERRGRAGDRG